MPAQKCWPSTEGRRSPPSTRAPARPGVCRHSARVRICTTFLAPLRDNAHYLCSRFFASYGRTEAGWVYYFGDFAAQTLPMKDSVHLSLKIQNGSDVAFAEITVRCSYFVREKARAQSDALSFRTARACRRGLSLGRMHQRSGQTTASQPAPRTASTSTRARTS